MHLLGVLGCGLENLPKHERRVFSPPGLTLAAQGEGHHSLTELGQEKAAVRDRCALAIEDAADHTEPGRSRRPPRDRRGPAGARWSRLYRAIQETGVLLALLDGKTDVDTESDEVMSLADPGDHL